MTNTRDLAVLEPGVADRRQTEGGEWDHHDVSTELVTCHFCRRSRRIGAVQFNDLADSGRLLCTSSLPMPADHKGQWLHPEAVCTGSCSSGCCDDYECPACGTSWSSELPE